MAVLTGARTRIELQPPPLAQRGILQTARVIPVTGHQLLGVEAVIDWCGVWAEQWAGTWCATPQAQCPAVVSQTATPKTFEDRTGTVEGDPIVIFAGSDCPTDTLQERQDKAERALTYGESARLDIALQEWLDAEWTANGGTTPHAFDSIECGIGAMDAFIAGAYSGRGVIWLPLPLAAAAYGKGVCYRELDGGLVSPGDNHVAVVLTPQPIDQATAYEAWATGAVTLLQGPVESHSVPPMIAKDGTCAPARALAERVYVPIVECIIEKFTLTCPVTP